MTLGLVGRKIGMTRLFTDDGDAVPVTVVDVSNNRVTQVKTPKPTATARYRSPSKTPSSRVTRLGQTFCQGGVEAGHLLSNSGSNPTRSTKLGGPVGPISSRSANWWM
jgi:large subunit ribosomal protein L3